MAKPIPESCSSLDLERVGLELIKAGGSVRVAAKALGVPPRNLRRLTDALPDLLDQALEATERALDEAEAMVLEAVRGEATGRGIKAAGLYLRSSSAGRRRGFR